MIGEFEKPVIDVPDLDEGAKFWSALTGFEIGERFDPLGKFLGLGRHKVDGHMSVRLLLQKVDHPITAGSTHLDFKVRDIAKAVSEVEAIGGRVKKPAAYYPDAHPDGPYLEWVVMQDPWGTPFCLVRWPI